ncbi:MAG: hypothetical protein KC636_09640, partial [Myxococcales bacterium]|nr:hypothetical protein [Myxococcales bacterium]
MRTPVVLPLAACTLLACRTATPDLRPKDVTERPPATAPAVPPGVAAIEALTDPARDPCTQFSAFACAGWTAQARAEGRVGRQAWREVEMAAHTRAQLETWLATPADADARDDATALRRFYAVCVADLATRVPGHPAVASLEEAIAAVDDVASFLRVSGLLVAHRIPGLFTVWQFPIDGAYAPLVRGYVSDRTPEDGPELAVARRGRLLAALSAYQPAKVEARADAVLAFEDRLHELLARAEDGEIIAAASLPSRPATRRLPFAAFLDGWAAPERAAVHVFPDGYVDRLGPLLRDTAATTLRDYLRWTLVDGLVQSLPGRFADDPRWPPASTCTSLLEDLAGLELARALGRAAFGDDARARAEQIAARVRVELDGVLEESTWLDRQVRSLLRRQLAAARLRLGYGDDAPPLPAMGDDHLANALALRRASFLRRVARDPAYDRPWDDDGWMLLHATAWSDRFVPGVNVSLGMFNAPVFDPQRPLALDVAALGSILGHELMHWTDP